jgi:hypothetical protein
MASFVTAPDQQRTTPRRSGALRCIRGTELYCDPVFVFDRPRQIMSFAAISPPPAISAAASASVVLGWVKPARIKKPVDNSGVA